MLVTPQGDSDQAETRPCSDFIIPPTAAALIMIHMEERVYNVIKHGGQGRA